MCVLPELTCQRTLLQLESAAAVYFSDTIEVGQTPSELALLRGVDRSTIYRRAARLPQLLSTIPTLQSRVAELSTQNFLLQQLFPLYIAFQVQVWFLLPWWHPPFEKTHLYLFCQLPDCLNLLFRVYLKE